MIQSRFAAGLMARRASAAKEIPKEVQHYKREVTFNKIEDAADKKFSKKMHEDE